MQRTRMRLHLLTFAVLAAAATGSIAGCLADGDGGPSLNPQPLPPQSPDEERGGGDVPTTSPPGDSEEGASGGDNPGSSSSSSGSSGSAVERDGGADAR